MELINKKDYFITERSPRKRYRLRNAKPVKSESNIPEVTKFDNLKNPYIAPKDDKMKPFIYQKDQEKQHENGKLIKLKAPIKPQASLTKQQKQRMRRAKYYATVVPAAVVQKEETLKIENVSSEERI